MQKLVFSTILGLSIVAGSLSAARPAHATLWRNYGSRFLAQPLYATIFNTNGSGKGTGIVLVDRETNPVFGQDFNLAADYFHPGYSFLVSTTFHDPSTGVNLVIGVQNNVEKAGTPLIAWSPTAQLNQDWRADYCFPDNNGAPCYALYNANSTSVPGNHVFVMGVSGGTMANFQQTILWDYLADPTNHPDQFWCTYTVNGSGQVVPELH